MKLDRSLRAARARAEYHSQRITAELDFAAELCALHPDRAVQWQPSIDRARALVAQSLAGDELGIGADTVRRAEKELAPLARVAKDYAVHCVGHAHVDMNWMWSWPETVSVTVDTFETVLALMDEYPGFRFSQSQASMYRIVEEHRPDLLERIAAQVRAGRWEVTASHWVEGDKNLVSGESLCRHLLYTRDYLRELFGLKPEDVPIDWAPDTFGHAATVPTYLARGGVRYVYMHRPGADEAPRPWLFWWQGPDGSRVLVRNDSGAAYGYNGQVSASTILRDWARFTRETGLHDHMFVYGVGDHGGGPTRRDLEQILDLDQWPIFPSVRFARACEYMERAAAAGQDLPVLERELNFEFAGCYTSQSLIKRSNRWGENRLADAETAATLAGLSTGLEYPRRTLVQGWRDILFGHFHDILPGSGVRDTRTYTHGLFQKTMAASAQAETRALRALAQQVGTAETLPDEGEQPPAPPSHVEDSTGAGVGFQSAEGALAGADKSGGGDLRPFLVFNPTALERCEVVEATVWATRTAGRPLRERSFAVRDPAGSVIPAQVVGGGDYWGHQFAQLAFPVRVAGLGYGLYTVVETDDVTPVRAGAWQLGAEHPCPYSMRERSEEGLENERMCVRLDPATGGICSLVDKESGLDLIDPEAPTAPLEFTVERPHGMSAWLVEHPQGPPEYPRVRALRRTRKGPHSAAIEVDLEVRESQFTVTYELRAGEPRLQVRIEGTWFQRGTPQTGVPALSYRLALALEDARGRYEIPFGAIDRPHHHREEVPALTWAQVHGRHGKRPAGCVVANDCKYGHSLEDNVLRVSLIRSSHEPDVLPEIGQHQVRLTLRPFAGTLSVTQGISEGLRLNHPLRLVSTDLHTGSAGPAGQFVRVTPADVVLSAVKQAEDGDGLILRLYNPTQQDLTAQVTMDPELVGRAATVEEVDLLERPVGGEGVRLLDDCLSVGITARGITTVRARLSSDREEDPA